MTAEIHAPIPAGVALPSDAEAARELIEAVQQQADEEARAAAFLRSLIRERQEFAPVI